MSKLAFLAPNWTVSQLRGMGQLGRALYDALHGKGARVVTGHDWKGQPYTSMDRRLTAAADTLPSPISLDAFIVKDPKSPVGYSVNRQPSSLVEQGLAMVGMKVDNAKSARAQMYQVAEKYRGGGQAHGRWHPATGSAPGSKVFADTKTASK